MKKVQCLERSDGLQRTLGTLEESPGPAAAEDGRSPDRHGTLRRTASTGRIESHTHG